MESSAHVRKMISQSQTRFSTFLAKEYEDLLKQLEEERKELVHKFHQEKEHLMRELEAERRKGSNHQHNHSHTPVSQTNGLQTLTKTKSETRVLFF